MTGETTRDWTKIFGYAVLGAAAMYILDPAKGHRRRAIVRDKLGSIVADTGEMMRIAARDARFRIEGLRARAVRLAHRGEIPDDLKLIERVRANLGRICSHPHAIQVGANHGRVTLSGPILASEAQSVLDAARSTWGVAEVEDCLVLYEEPNSVSSLQGGIARRGTTSELMQDSWTPALRIAAVAGGTALAFTGARRGGLVGVALAALGLAIAARGSINAPLTRLVGLEGKRRVQSYGAVPADRLAASTTQESKAREHSIATSTGGTPQ